MAEDDDLMELDVDMDCPTQLVGNENLEIWVTSNGAGSKKQKLDRGAGEL